MKRSRKVLCPSLMRLCLVLLAANLLCTPAEATLIELEPDMFRVGTNVTNLFEGMTMYRISGYEGASSTNLYNRLDVALSPTPTYSPVYIETDTSLYDTLYRAPTGELSFGAFRRLPAWGGEFSALMIQFDRPTNYFEIAGSWNMDEHLLSVIYADDRPLSFNPMMSRTALWGFPNLSMCYFCGTDSPAADIVRIGSLDDAPYIKAVFVGGWENPATLDRIRFNSVPSTGVPEPSSLLMLGVGLAGLMLWRRKQAA